MGNQRQLGIVGRHRCDDAQVVWRTSKAELDGVHLDIFQHRACLLSHRLIISPYARIKNVNADSILEDIVKATPVPGTKVTR